MRKTLYWIRHGGSLMPDLDPAGDFLAALSHSIGLIAALVGTTLLLHKTAGRPYVMLLAGIFGFSMCLVYASSMLTHGMPSSLYKRFFRILDQCSIYILIAGTYTPLSLVMEPHAANRMLITVWTLCLLGILVILFFWGRLRFLPLLFYLGMGWLLLFFWDPLKNSLPPAFLHWILIGGIFYTTGVVFFSLKRLPYAHFIWHIFVMAGSLCMFLGIYHILLPQVLNS